MEGDERWHRTGWRCGGCGAWNDADCDVCVMCGLGPPEEEWVDWEDDEDEEWYEEFEELGGEG